MNAAAAASTTASSSAASHFSEHHNSMEYMRTRHSFCQGNSLKLMLYISVISLWMYMNMSESEKDVERLCVI